MIPGSRRILADHLFKRYFDFGMGFDPLFPGASLHSLQEILNIVSTCLYNKSSESYCSRIAEKIFAFAQSTPVCALEVLIEQDDEYRKVIDDLLYSCSDSRYDLVLASLHQRPSREMSLPEASRNEYGKCDEEGTRLWIVRTGIFSLASAHEAIRRGRINNR